MRPLTIFLKQHTPLIHFQHQQSGATLRATEVKPKLDRYLIRRLGGWENIDRSWKANAAAENNRALNYKLKIQSSRNNTPVNPDRIAKGYFGNMGDDNAAKYLVESTVPLELSIQCFLPDLRTRIEENLRDFFLTHNFGTRQNRGYGSFAIDGELGRPSTANYSFRVYSDYYHSFQSTDLALITLEVIDWFYKSLRQGINHGTFRGNFIPYLYMKPMLFQYAASRGVQWEKKTIKEWFFDGQLEAQQENHHPEDDAPDPLQFSSPHKRLVRDLFGLSSEQTWMNYPGRNNRPSITKDDPTKTIERFPSPIRFKPIQHPDDDFMTVYFWYEPIPDVYRQASFKIKKDAQPNHHEPMKVWEEFDLEAFFTFAFAEGRLENSISVHHHNGRVLEDLLIQIYEDIRNNN